MYVAFENRVVDSNDFKKIIEENSEFKILKDMSKGSKREDIVAFNMSIGVDILNDILSDDYNIEEANEDDLFEEYLTLAEEIATDIEEFLPHDVMLDVRAYKWDESDNDIKLVLAICHMDLGENKLRDVMKRLLKQCE